jgi:hypothetical protein
VIGDPAVTENPVAVLYPPAPPPPPRPAPAPPPATTRYSTDSGVTIPPAVKEIPPPSNVIPAVIVTDIIVILCFIY